MAGAYGTPNRQPIFTQAPILQASTFDPIIISDNYQPGNTTPTLVYTGQSQEGDLIDRIIISATGDISNTTVTAKLVYVYINWYNAGSPLWSLYKTLAMPGTTVSATTPNPTLELTFTGGLVINQTDRIYIGASVNYSTNYQYGDYLSVTIEGGRYTLNP